MHAGDARQAKSKNSRASATVGEGELRERWLPLEEYDELGPTLSRRFGPLREAERKTRRNMDALQYSNEAEGRHNENTRAS